jgi:CheY-like chemotaxis protein
MPSAAKPFGSVPAPGKVGGRVLVVDDNSVNRKILARQLELAGASPDTAAGGEEALELWRKGGYDLVLADLQMPTMDGFELARRIRQSEQTLRRPRTPILAITASAPEEQEHKTRIVGMDGLITKPIGIEQLRATLDVWLKDARTEQAT